MFFTFCVPNIQTVANKTIHYLSYENECGGGREWRRISTVVEVVGEDPTALAKVTTV
jgi:hypothetical protein